jgi:5-methylcytosine-specific restriction endonuclease McrA
VVFPWGRRKVLLLNATFEPLTALSLRRAVVLVVCGKAEVVHGDASGLVLHSSKSEVLVPSVIRLSSYVRVPYRGRVPMTRAGLMHRDRYRCAYCGGRAETVDHIVPRSRGGTLTWDNAVAACIRCNHRKADRTPAEAGMHLLLTPAQPHYVVVA